MMLDNRAANIPRAGSLSPNGQSPKRSGPPAPADGSPQRVNRAVFGPSRPAAPATQRKQDQLSLYQMEFGAYSLLARGHNMSVRL